MSKGNEIRGVRQRNEVKTDKRFVDVRSKKDKFKEKLENPDDFLMYAIAPLVVGALFPVLLPFALCLSVVLIVMGKGLYSKLSLPMKMPKSIPWTDPMEITPLGKAAQSDGIAYFGNERENDSKKEIWFTNSDMRTHILMMGTTGAGKTEALLSIAYNSLIWGSGFVYVDGKGTTELYTKIFGMARAMGREDDLLVINYMKGNKDLIGPQETKLSNTTNPFTSGSANSLTELVVSLMDSGQGGDDMWKGRATSLMSSLMAALVYLRDQKEFNLDVEKIREYLVLKKIYELSKRPLPEHISLSISAYLKSIPGWDDNKGDSQSDTVMEQHGYLQMQFTKVLGTLADAYGHIFKTNFGEVNFWDVAVNRRILVVLLPALEFSEPELANLGKIILASLRSMMATGLGSLIEGTIQEVVEVNPTKGNTPFMVILDEYGYYAVKGSAVMPAQARGLGFSMIFAGQDYPSFKKATPEEAAAIAANCSIKICLKLEDPQETFELFKAAAGQSYVTVNTGYETGESSLLGGDKKYKQNKGINIDMKDRIDLRDLQVQASGQGHVFFASNIARINFFYANPPKCPEIRINHFLKVQTPLVKELMLANSEISNTISKLLDEQIQNEIMTYVQDAYPRNVTRLTSYLGENGNGHNTEMTIKSLMMVVSAEMEKNKNLEKMVDSKKEVNEKMDIFNTFADEMPESLLIKNISDIQRSIGDDQKESSSYAINLAQSMKEVTKYGKESVSVPSIEDDEFMDLINELSRSITKNKNEEANSIGHMNYDDDDDEDGIIG